MNALDSFPPTTLILAGGYGSRMGGEKLALAVDSEPLLLKVIRKVRPFAEEILLSVAPCQIPYVSTVLSGIIFSYGIRVVEDPAEERSGKSLLEGKSPGKNANVPPCEKTGSRGGPLAGIVAGLEASSSEWLFVCACDMPRISEMMVRTLWKHGDKNAFVIVPLLGGFYEPLHAFYRKDCLMAAKNILQSGRRKITAFYDSIPVSTVSEDLFSHLPGYRRSFENLNNRCDLEKMIGLFS